MVVRLGNLLFLRVGRLGNLCSSLIHNLNIKRFVMFGKLA